MIFKSIRLKNFRQYKKEITIEFAIPQGNSNNITLIIAANGVGKTTLLQAIRYCFYGSSSNYLNLPKANELVNNTLEYDLKELDKDVMFVEVSFIHEGIKYLARREKRFIKLRGHLKDEGKEIFLLSRLTENDGWKYFKESEAIQKIRSILPEGLSQVFMFDGERMERKISESKFSEELKESILGILDIKKYDKLIEILGHEGKASSVIGMLNSRKKTLTEDDKRTKDKYDQLLAHKEAKLMEIKKYQDKVDDIKQKISITEEQQLKLKENEDRIRRRKEIENIINSLETEIKNLAQRYIKESKNALIYKLLLLNKEKYDSYIKMGKKENVFYSYLHINTINDILEKKICVCGRPIEEHSSEKERLESLKRTSLPLTSSQHLNMIDQKFKKSVEFREEMNRLTDLKKLIKQSKLNIERYKGEYTRLIKEIADIENKYGIRNQLNITELENKKEQYLQTIGELTKELKLTENGINRYKKKIDIMDSNIEYNRRINKVIEYMKDIKDKLEQIKNEKDNQAREMLSKNFDKILNKTIHGNYKAEINNKYQVKIIDSNTNKDVTISLSTGQNVVVLLSFINALIHTAKELSATINKNEKYGVVMDAAMSNLDEMHIEKLCRYNINNLDQIIFLSFKRQLRDEMYISIKHNIGKAYFISKHPKGYIENEEMSLNRLDQFIHSIEGEEYDKL
jgi:DNA sulfur modification protein DndD